MKVSATLFFALAGAAISNPVTVEKRQLEARALPLVPVLGGGAVSSLPPGLILPSIPNLPATGGLALSSGDVVPAVTSLIQSILVTIVNLLQGLPGNNLPIPGIGSFPNIPGLIPITPTVPISSLTPEQLITLALGLQYQLGNLTALGSNLPTGGLIGGTLTGTQLGVFKSALESVQAQLAPILATGNGALATLGSLNGALPGGVPNLGQLQGLLAAIGPVLNLVNGLISIVTGILGGGAGIGIGL